MASKSAARKHLNVTIIDPGRWGLTYGIRRSWYYKMRLDFFTDEAILGLSSDAVKVFLAIILQSLRQSNASLTVSLEFLSTLLVSSKGALMELKHNNIIQLDRNVRTQLIEENRREEKSIECGKDSASPPILKNQRYEGEDLEFVTQVVDNFNAATGKKIGYQSKNNSYILKGKSEGYSLENFFHVIKVKTHEWKNCPKMASSLKISTLFAECHFEDYLNEEIMADPGSLIDEQKLLEVFNTPIGDDGQPIAGH